MKLNDNCLSACNLNIGGDMINSYTIKIKRVKDRPLRGEKNTRTEQPSNEDG